VRGFLDMGTVMTSDPATLRFLRLRALEAARQYRDSYRRERFGMQRRMVAQMLALALEYRRAGQLQQERNAA
jgi:hypothetical protein